MKKPIFLDTTLRDGEQSPGIYFTHDEKLAIARELDRIGIEIIEAGIPSMGDEERKCLCALKKLNLKAEIMSWNRLLIDDIAASFIAEVTNIHVSVPTSDIMIGHKLGKTRDWIFSQMEAVISFGIKEGASISFGAEDASRTHPDFLKKVFGFAQELGAKRVRFADTLGILTPSQLTTLIPYLSDGLSIPIDFHGHNDFGLATANALTAWEGGADVISCSVLGLGERAGNTSLEEFAGVVQFVKEAMTDFDFISLKKLCQTISLWIDSPISDRKPMIGDKIYTHESGIHIDGLLKEPSTYEYFPPAQVGGCRKLIVGKHSGRKAIRHLANEQGYRLTDEQIEDFLKNMRLRMATTRGINADILFNDFLMYNAKTGGL